jgi:hypothetical protein
MSKELLHEVGEALKEFAQPEDLKPRENKPVYGFDEGGLSRFNFRRGNFKPGHSRVSSALAAYEDGDPQSLIEIDRELKKQGVTLELDRKKIGDTDKTLIMGIILVCRGNALELCGIK